MKSILASTFFLFFISSAVAQRTDSIAAKSLNQVIVKGYYNPQAQLRAVGAVSILDSSSFKNYDNTSLLSSINSISGVRMEERSPGSYRLSLRGSLLRSPFGIRNIKIYMDDFPLTDAGGNTYLNLIDPAGIGAIEVYKGPEGSNFGATTGGALLITPTTENQNSLSADLTAGSYGLFRQSVKWQQVIGRYRFNVTQGYQTSEGYREHSALSRKYIQTFHQWNYAQKGYLKAFLFYSDLDYQTPGGLTAAQLELNPRSARPATATLPSAITQHAGIVNRTIFGGISNTYQFTAKLKHITAVFASNTDFKNPFITNYEKRKERSVGLRTLINYDFRTLGNDGAIQLGMEAASTVSDVENYGNSAGAPINLQAADDLIARQQFSFLRLNFDINDRLFLELGTSLNFFGYTYQTLAPISAVKQNRDFDDRLMPKFAFSYLLTDWMSIRSSVSKGYSPPTLAEVRSSDNLINTNLQAEYGWNYEAGIRIKPQGEKLYADLNVFYFHLKDAIVRRLNNDDIEYFINAGGTNQLGTEFQLSYLLFKNDDRSTFNRLKLNSSYTYQHFRFDNFRSANQDLSGNRLTGVPTHTIVSSIDLTFAKWCYLFLQHQSISSIPLNDANTVFANRYHLIDAKTGIRNLRIGSTSFDLSFGINNLLDKRYSLGNDLNAASNRFYNPATGINFYTGLTAKLF